MNPTETATAPRQGASPERAALYWIGGLLGGLVVAIVVVLWLFNWNMLRGPLARFASNATGRHVRIDGDLKVHLLTFTPRISIGGLKIGQPAWAGAGDMAQIDRLVVEVKLFPLLIGHVVAPLLELDHPVLVLRRDATGRANWTFASKPNSKPSALPPIERFVIDHGHIDYADAGRKMTIVGAIDSNERAGGASAHAFSLVGEGSMNAKPFHVNISGGPLINVNTNAPYPFSGDVRAGDTRIVASGTIAKAFDLSSYETNLHVTGRDLADLYYLTGLTLPNSPAYELRGRLSHAGKVYSMTGITGRVGSSDLAGQFSVDNASGRPFVNAALRSHALNFDDLATLFGAAPVGKSAAVATPEQKAQSAAMAANQRLLPDATLYTDRLRKMDARLVFTADTVKTQFIPLRSAALKLSLDHGLLNIDPLTMDLPQGRVTAYVALNARGAVPVTTLDARLSNAELKNFIPTAKGPDAPIEGNLVARVKLTGVGDSVHRAAAASNGAMTAVIPHGHIRQAFAELLGVNVGKGLGLLLSKNKDNSDIRCGVASFIVKDGVMRADQIVFDTDVVRVNGTGSVNLGSETIDLTLKGDTKHFRVTHVFLPITLGGHLRSPAIGVQPASAIAQGGAALALGAFLTPLAAILPFVDPGLGKNADCAALMSTAKQNAAPVKGALNTTPAKP